MSGVDVILIALLAVGAAIGLAKGIVRLVVGLVALIAAFALSAAFHGALAARFADGTPGPGARMLAYAALFFGVLLLGSALAWLLRTLVRAVMLGWIDRLAGGAIGLFAATLLAAFVLLPLVAYVPESRDWLARSKLAPYVVGVADVVRRAVPGELSERWRTGVKEVRDRWSGTHEEPVEI